MTDLRLTFKAYMPTEIVAKSKNKQTQYAQVMSVLPKDIQIKFNDKNGNYKLDPGEWFEYEQNGQRHIYYSPHAKDNYKEMAEKFNLGTPKSEAVTIETLKAQLGTEKPNPNRFLHITLPIKPAKSSAPAAEPVKGKAAAPAATGNTAEPTLPESSVKDAKKIGKFEHETHIVKKGDNLHDLSIKLNTTPDELKKLNGLNSDVLQIGQKLNYYSNRERYGFNKDIPDSVYLTALKNKLEGAFQGKEKVILKAAKDNNIPVSVLYAIMTQETGHGTSNFVKNRNNPGGIKINGTQTHRTFKTLDDGINTMAKLLAAYHRRGLDTLEEIRPIYSEDSVNWVNNTTFFQNSFCEELTKAETAEKEQKSKKK